MEPLTMTKEDTGKRCCWTIDDDSYQDRKSNSAVDCVIERNKGYRRINYVAQLPTHIPTLNNFSLL